MRDTGLAGISCGSEFFLFRSGNPRDDCFIVDVAIGLSILSAEQLARSDRDNSAMGLSIPDAPFNFCSCAFFLRAAARACNFDIFGASSDEPPKRPPRGYKGAIKTACRSSGTLSHGISLKKSENENGLARVFEHSTAQKSKS